MDSLIAAFSGFLSKPLPFELPEDMEAANNVVKHSEEARIALVRKDEPRVKRQLHSNNAFMLFLSFFLSFLPSFLVIYNFFTGTSL